jgi:hypothetical protein
MNRRIYAVLMSALLLGSWSLFADDKGKMKDEEKTKVKKVKVEEKTTVPVTVVKTRNIKPVSNKRVARINTDVNRLESILATAQNSSVAFPQPTLTRIANEANSLANRIWADAHKLPNAAAVAAASDLRMHVREMHKAAASGDAAGVRMHAGQALSSAVRLDGLG